MLPHVTVRCKEALLVGHTDHDEAVDGGTAREGLAALEGGMCGLDDLCVDGKVGSDEDVVPVDLQHGFLLHLDYTVVPAKNSRNPYKKARPKPR